MQQYLSQPGQAAYMMQQAAQQVNSMYMPNSMQSFAPSGATSYASPLASSTVTSTTVQQQQQQQAQAQAQQAQTAAAAAAAAAAPPGIAISQPVDIQRSLVALLNPDERGTALLELSRQRVMQDMGPLLWNSYGVVAALLQEIVAVYPMLSPPTLTPNASNRVCNALALLQNIASHNETRSQFLNAHIPLFLYPFLNTTTKTKPFDYLRVTSVGVIGALVKNESTEVVHFLLSSEIIPLCLRIMENGSELSKMVAIFIVHKILMDEVGLSFVCQTYERFLAVATVLGNMVTQLAFDQHALRDQLAAQTQTVRIFKHIFKCYIRLCDNKRAREALRQRPPEILSTQLEVFRDLVLQLQAAMNQAD